MNRYSTITTEVDVEIDVVDLLDGITDRELLEMGYSRIGRPVPHEYNNSACQFEPSDSLTEHLYACAAIRRS